MKTNLIKMLAALSLVASVGANLAVAEETGVEAKIPFAFYMGDQKLPAGHYQAKVDRNGAMVMLRDKKTGNGGVAIAIRAGGSTNTIPAKLVFEKVNDSYFLHQVWTGENSGGQLPQSKVRRELVAKNTHREIVTVAAE